MISWLLCITIITLSLLSTSTIAFIIHHTKSSSLQSSNNLAHLSMAASSSSSSINNNQPCALVDNPPDTKAAKGVIFDIDGTLADSWKLGYDATVVVLQKNDLGHVPINEDIYHATCVYPTPERLARTAGLLPEKDADTFLKVGEDLGKQFDEYYVKLVSLETCEYYDGIRDILQNLPDDVQLGALTNACVAYGYAVIQCNDKHCDEETKSAPPLYDRFGTIHGADSVPAAKPSPKGLLVSAQELSLDPDQCIYVGDAIGDGKAARAAGMISIGVTWGSNSQQKLKDANVFDYLCTTREELKDLLPQK